MIPYGRQDINDKDIEGVSPLDLSKRSEFRRIRAEVNSSPTKSISERSVKKKPLSNKMKTKMRKAMVRLKKTNRAEDQLKRLITVGNFKVRNCFWKLCLDKGHNLLPEPPHNMTGNTFLGFITNIHINTTRVVYETPLLCSID